MALALHVARYSSVVRRRRCVGLIPSRVLNSWERSKICIGGPGRIIVHHWNGGQHGQHGVMLITRAYVAEIAVVLVNRILRRRLSWGPCWWGAVLILRDIIAVHVNRGPPLRELPDVVVDAYSQDVIALSRRHQSMVESVAQGVI